MNEYIEHILSQLNDLSSNSDLVDVGIFRTENEANRCRKYGKSPDYFKLPNKHILYPKDAVRKFLEESMKDGKEPIPTTRAYNKKQNGI